MPYLAVAVALLAVGYVFLNDTRPAPPPRGGGGNQELRAADLRGRLSKAEAYAQEVNSRLDAYRSRFDCDEALLLDRCFLDPDGPLAIHPLRKQWYELRSELPEYLEKHRVYLSMLREAAADLSPAKVDENYGLPERATAWSNYLDHAITARTRKLPMFTQVARTIKLQLNLR
jgi:hypothetical protein